MRPGRTWAAPQRSARPGRPGPPRSGSCGPADLGRPRGGPRGPADLGRPAAGRAARPTWAAPQRAARPGRPGPPRSGSCGPADLGRVRGGPPPARSGVGGSAVGAVGGGTDPLPGAAERRRHEPGTRRRLGSGVGHAGVVSGAPGGGPIGRTGTLGDIGGQDRRALRASRPPGRPADLSPRCGPDPPGVLRLSRSARRPRVAASTSSAPAWSPPSTGSGSAHSRHSSSGAARPSRPVPAPPGTVPTPARPAPAVAAGGPAVARRDPAPSLVRPRSASLSWR